MSKKNTGSVAPKERVNISYKPAVGDGKKQIELPMKLLVLGDFTNQPDDRIVEERDVINVNNNNIDSVMASLNLNTSFTVKNHLTEGGEDLEVNFSPKSISDFTPDKLAESVPELKRVLELRAALKALKGPLGNVPQMRKHIQKLIQDSETREKLIKEISTSEK